MGLPNRVYNLIKIQIGEDMANNYSLHMSDNSTKIIETSEGFFKNILNNHVDNMELYKYIEVSYEEIDVETWIKKIACIVLPKIREVLNG